MWPLLQIKSIFRLKSVQHNSLEMLLTYILYLWSRSSPNRKGRSLVTTSTSRLIARALVERIDIGMIHRNSHLELPNRKRIEFILESNIIQVYLL